MADLKVDYLGLKLKNPLVVGASNLVTDIETLQKLEKAGAAAIVYKSLFEEQIQWEAYEMEQEQEVYSNWDAEHASIFPELGHAGPSEYLIRIKRAKQAIGIPLIASLNCVNLETWVEYASKLADTGVDALELNFYHNLIDPKKTCDQVVIEQLEALIKIKKVVKIPVSVKLSPYYTNIIHAVKEFDKAGADGFIMFNRLFQPDIDVDKMEHHYPYNFSNENDIRLALRYTGLLHGEVKGTIISSNGIYSGKDAVKMILAGADAVQVVSAVYKKGIKQITQMLNEMTEWMDKNKFKNLEAFRGKLSKNNMEDPFAYKRAQYIDILMRSDVFMKYHPKESESIK